MSAADVTKARVASSITELPNGAARKAAPAPPADVVPASTPVVTRVVARARTSFGDTVHLARAASPIPLELRCERDGIWARDARLEVESDLVLSFGVSHGQDPRVNWQRASRSLPVPPSTAARGRVLVVENFDEGADDALRSAAFSRVIFRRDSRSTKADGARAASAAVKAAAALKGGVALVLGARAPRVETAHAVYVVGATDALGAWDNASAVRLCDADAPLWSVCIPMARDALERGLEYRFIIKHVQTGAVVTEEEGVRVLQIADEMRELVAVPGTAPVVLAYVNSGFRYSNQWRGAGVALPVFSIRTKDSCGVGEFNDLPKLVDFCKATGHQMLQLLPVNDTTSYNSWRDSYPYSAVSCFALHPQYINIESLGVLSADMRREYDEERTRLNALSQIDYEEVMRVKMSFIRRMYAAQKDDFLRSAEFSEWFETQRQWLVPYALFRFFMQVNGTAEYDKWGARASLSAGEMETFSDPESFHFDYLGMVYFTQFHLHKQLEHASQYAAQREVVFKGDLPIGVNRYCADTWLNPHLFRLNMQAGAPPDSFSEIGQNWGFPTYDWDAMKSDGYKWWKQRLGHMSKYFHAYRIDHILGFFRIWEIPSSFRTGMSGRLRPVHPIRKAELETRGLWDIDRLTKPYVHDKLLQSMLGDDWWSVRQRYFNPSWEDRLCFKPEFDTEVKIEAELAPKADTTEWTKALNKKKQQVLFRLLNNVILLRDDDDTFHPRFSLTSTSSFQELPSDEWKQVLNELYDDYFFKRQEHIWRQSAMEKLPMMKEASDMLVCGEDLGFVPACVPSVMRDTGILGLAVQRMPPGDDEFGHPLRYRYSTVASTSSHDVSTLRAWWEDLDDGARERYWQSILGWNGSARRVCDADIVKGVLAQHLQSPAMWVVTPIQDLLGIDEDVRRENAKEEQINEPSNPKHYWRFRLHRDIDQILANHKLVAELKQLNQVHGRGCSY